MPSLAIARAANATFAPDYLPVAVFVGGTAGIGQGIAEAFARHVKGNAHIILCGRNRAAAESIIASFPKPSAPDAGAVHEFVECDAALMKNIEATASQLRARLPRINFLVLSPGFLSMKGRDETAEGIDKRLALHYYARWKFTHDLLPLLQNAQRAGQRAAAMTVLAAGGGALPALDDLGLKKSYTAAAAGLASPVYNDLMVESFAAQSPGVSFVHAHPGIVRTNLLKAGHWTLQPLVSLLMAALYPVSVSPADCGEHMLWGLLQAHEGASHRNSKGEDIGKPKFSGPEETRRALWDHTVAETQRAVRVGALS